ncbi:hypothetical protein B9Z65_8782 [Elsinoe australis]|uniref:C2H2-type domain-containing protein n=1 Tax=Elsinoe australis TaxID=40998 RepID=A0A2P7YER1_9PEZI|nr:hypothetical protein B9Z65_8782 [Elsinoe australis]
MSIPNSDRAPAPPPPLPPPTNVEELGLTQDQSWPFNNNPNWQGFGLGGRLDESGDGRSRNNPDDATAEAQEIDPVRKPSSATTITPALPRDIMDMDGSTTPSDEGLPGASPNYRLHSERQLEQRSLNTSSHAYDRNLLSKIGGPNTPVRTLSYSSSNGEPASLSPGLSDIRQPALKRLSMPERRRSSNDARYNITSNSRNNSSTSILSPTSFRSSSIFEAPEISRLAGRRNPSLTFDDSSSSHRGSHDSNMFPHEEFPMEEGQMKDLNLNDRSPGAPDDYLVGPRAGMKRRASSPQRDTTRLDRASVGSAAGATDLYHRRSLQQFPPRSSPAPRYNYPHHSSVSSASSFGHRTASLGSSHGLSVASSVTTLSSGRLSPSALSPAIDPELCPPFPSSKSLNPSPRSSISTQQLVRPGPEQINHAQLATMAEGQYHNQPVPGVLICDCCPKKPKKFNTEEDLRLHHMEKQYTCAYCPNRFKNKNEAERHQNSLHLRRHSWSCAALPSIEHVFHASSSNGGATDVCGYCGDEFSNPADWEERRNHLSVVHKFGECNQVKKFFRADHFRQHLKHSHGGTSGKWTNILENACMRDEPPPIPMNRSSMSGPTGAYPQMGTALPPPGAIAPQGRQPATINEVPQER